MENLNEMREKVMYISVGKICQIEPSKQTCEPKKCKEASKDGPREGINMIKNEVR